MDKSRRHRRVWEELRELRVEPDFYDVEGFLRGEYSLVEVEREEVGDVAGKTLLHLHCRFGLDTLCWARLGAEVTGVDFSEKAIGLARSLAEKAGIAARFLCCDPYDLPDRLSGEFDMVLTTAGVLPWLPDLRQWAQVVARFLKPGGFFYLREFHPAAGIFDDGDNALVPVVRYPYFRHDEPVCFEQPAAGKPADDTGGEVENPGYEWTHSLGDIINSLVGAGLRIEFLHEFPYSTYRSHPFLTQTANGLWRYEPAPHSLALMFSLRADK